MLQVTGYRLKETTDEFYKKMANIVIESVYLQPKIVRKEIDLMTEKFVAVE